MDLRFIATLTFLHLFWEQPIGIIVNLLMSLCLLNLFPYLEL